MEKKNIYCIVIGVVLALLAVTVFCWYSGSGREDDTSTEVTIDTLNQQNAGAGAAVDDAAKHALRNKTCGVTDHGDGDPVTREQAMRCVSRRTSSASMPSIFSLHSPMSFISISFQHLPHCPPRTRRSSKKFG